MREVFCKTFYPEGIIDNSPTFQRWVPASITCSPEGTADRVKIRLSLRRDLKTLPLVVPTLKGVLPKRAGKGTERGQPCPRSGNVEIPVRIAHERARGEGC